MSIPTLGYWDIRGLCEPIRYLLKYKGVDFEDKRYVTGSDEWFKQDKLKLGLDFPNLPYYIEGDLKITQSTAILRYVARKHGLVGKTEEEKMRIEIVEHQLADLRMGFFRICMNENFDKVKVDFVKIISAQAKLLENFLGDRKFLAGEDVTYVDFLAYDTLDFYRYISHKYLDEFPKLKNYQKRLAHLPELQEYFNSSTYRTWPIINPRATFAGKGPEPKREPL